MSPSSRSLSDCSRGRGCKLLSIKCKVRSHSTARLYNSTSPTPTSRLLPGSSTIPKFLLKMHSQNRPFYTYLCQECGAPPPLLPSPISLSLSLLSLFFKTYPTRLSSCVTSSVPHSSQPTVFLGFPRPHRH